MILWRKNIKDYFASLIISTLLQKIKKSVRKQTNNIEPTYSLVYRKSYQPLQYEDLYFPQRTQVIYP